MTGAWVVDGTCDEKCPVCGAKPGQPCRNTVRPGEPLPGRATHIARCEVVA